MGEGSAAIAANRGVECAVAVRDSTRDDQGRSALAGSARRFMSRLYIYININIKYIYRVMDLFGTSTSEERTTSSHLAPRASTPADPRSISPVPTCHSSALPTTPSLHSMFNIQYLYCRIISSFRYAHTPYFSFRRFLFDRVADATDRCTRALQICTIRSASEPEPCTRALHSSEDSATSTRLAIFRRVIFHFGVPN